MDWASGVPACRCMASSMSSKFHPVRKTILSMLSTRRVTVILAPSGKRWSHLSYIFNWFDWGTRVIVVLKIWPVEMPGPCRKTTPDYVKHGATIFFVKEQFSDFRPYHSCLFEGVLMCRLMLLLAYVDLLSIMFTSLSHFIMPFL